MKRVVLLLLLNGLIHAQIAVTVKSESLRSSSVNVAMHVGAGFFCEFRKVLMNLIHYDRAGISQFNVDWTSQFFPYKDGITDNGWDYYFDPITIYSNEYNPTEPIVQAPQIENHELHGRECVAQWIAYERYRPYYDYVNSILKKYIVIKPHILKEVEQIYEANLKGHFCIGVHVRYARAHIGETPAGHPSLLEYCNEVNALLAQHHDESCKIFIASDSNVVIEHFKNKYQDKVVYIETYRASNNEDPVLIYEKMNYYLTHPHQWHRDKPGYRGGLGILMDCLLLSKCDYFIHTTTSVADCVCFFNPAIASLYLPRKVTFKPCPQAGNKNIHNPYINPI